MRQLLFNVVMVPALFSSAHTL